MLNCNLVNYVSFTPNQMTKCTFHKFGGSGTIQRFDSLCVLSMNIVNEKYVSNFSDFNLS